MADLDDWYLEDLRDVGPALKGTDVRTQEAAERRAEAEREKIRDGTTFSDLTGAQAVQGTVGTIARSFEEARISKTPGYRLPENFGTEMKRLGIQEDQWPLFERATSQEHYDFLLRIARENQVADQDRAQFGVLANMGAELLDPGQFALAAASGGVSHSAKLGRLGNAALAGSVDAASVAGFDTVRADYDPNLTTGDRVRSALAAFAFAGAFGARAGDEFAALKAADAMARKPADDTLSAARVRGLAEDPTPGVAPLRGDTEVGARLEQEAVANVDRKSAFRGIRFDLSAQMNKMKSAVARAAGAKWFREGVGWADRSQVVEESATEFARRHAHAAEARYRYITNSAEAEWRKRTGTSMFNLGERAKFREEITRALRGEPNVSAEASQAASGLSQVFADLGRLAKESGVEGFEDFVPNANYVPRMFSKKGFARVFGELGLHEDDVLKQLVMPAMRRAWERRAVAEAGELAAETIDDKLLENVGKAWMRRAQANFEGDGIDLLMRPIASDDVTELRKLLDDAGVDKNDADALLFRLGDKADEGARIGRAKARIDMDETFQAKVLTDDGREVELKISDLLENDADKLVNSYAREISGWSAMSAKFGVRNRRDMDQLTASIRSDARKAGDDLKQLDRYLDIARKSTFGRSTETDDQIGGLWSKANRFVRDYNFTRVMNQVGFSLFAELGPLISYAGLGNTVRSVPAFKNFFRRAADGTLTNEEARIIEQMIPAGSDMARNPPFFRDPEDGELFSNAAARGADNAVQGLKYVTSVFSGMGPINSALQRVAANATLLRMMQLANKAKLSSAEVRRLRAYGLSEDSQAKVFAYLKGKRKIAQIKPDELDFTTRESMSAFLSRATRHQIVEGDPGDSLALMHSAGGKTLMQFRTFMVNSYTRHFLYGANNLDDWRTWSMVAFSTAFAGLGWSARQFLNAQGSEEKMAEFKQTMADARDFALGDESKWDNGLNKAAIQQSSWSSVIPMLTDVIAENILRGDPVFGNASRGTGLATGVMGIPALDLANKLYGSAGLPAEVLRTDKTINEKEVRDFWSLFFLNNMTGVRNIADSVIRELPERDDQQPQQ